MAATVPVEPATPAAVYRPLWFEVQRTDPAASQVGFIRPATPTDVSALGDGLEEGDILVYYAPISGPVPIAVGQTVLFANSEGYNGVHEVLSFFTESGDLYMVIDSQDFGAFDFSAASPPATVRVWLNNYTIYTKVLVYTDPTADPVEVILKGQPNLSGVTAFSVDKVIKDYLSTQNLYRFATGVGGGELIQNAHGLTALFYRVHIAEVYDVPGETSPVDPFDGAHDILVDDTDSVSTYRVAVNAIHPYRNWSVAGMDEYMADASETGKFLTEAPREIFDGEETVVLRMGIEDRFRVHFLTTNVTLGDNSPYEVGYQVRIREVNPDGTVGSLLLFKNADLPDISAAASIAIGPVDLALFMTVPDRYAVDIKADITGSTGAFERVVIEVDRSCKETSRPFIVLNRLGGVDHFSFTARELDLAQGGEAFYTASTRGLSKDERQWIVTDLLKRGAGATLKKFYGPGTGFDYTERAYKGALVLTRLDDDVVAPVIIETDTALAHSTGPIGKPLTIDYRLGVDQYSQQG